MNDRFLFRVMNKETKKYEHPSVVEESSVFLLSRVSSKYIVEQCTGLKDKNGKLIYEGDILRRKDSAGRVVEWDDNELTFLFTTLDGEASMPLARYNIQKLELEIVGNIHENPELLEAE